MSDAVVAVPAPFFGWRVVAGAFVLAVLGWGLGFYGPPVYLHAVRAARGWSVSLVAAAVTVHFLVGAVVVANLPGLYRRFGLPAVTRVGVVALAVGLVGWAVAAAPWQLFVATALTGGGWVTMGAAAVNAIVAPWFVRLRPRALSAAYNGASIGGVVFAPLWVALIGAVGFARAAAVVGGVTVVVVWWLAARVFGRTPEGMGQEADGGVVGAVVASAGTAVPLPGRALWRDRGFRSLAAGMALGLVAQIGLLAHLFSLIVPALGEMAAGVAMGLATGAAIVGRTAFGWLLPAAASRRRAAALSYGVQILGGGLLMLSALDQPMLIMAGLLLFGFGIGNATSLPPLIAQVEFAREDTGRVVALIVAIGQGAYAFAPACFGLVLDGAGAGAMLGVAMAVQAAAIGMFLWGRR